jgi:hypothetical protein
MADSNPYCDANVWALDDTVFSPAKAREPVPMEAVNTSEFLENTINFLTEIRYDLENPVTIKGVLSYIHPSWQPNPQQPPSPYIPPFRRNGNEATTNYHRCGTGEIHEEFNRYLKGMPVRHTTPVSTYQYVLNNS